MAKAIFVMDMPEKCGECVMRLQTTCAPAFEKIDSVKTKPDWCPLKPMPEKEKESDDSTMVAYPYTSGKKAGWNACIDAICGKE